jgi:hypothetical protein
MESFDRNADRVDQEVKKVERERALTAVENMKVHKTPLLDRIDLVNGRNGGWQEDYDFLKAESMRRVLSSEEQGRLSLRKKQLDISD